MSEKKKRREEKRKGTKTEKCNQRSWKAGEIKKKKETIKRKSHCQMRIRTNEEILKRGRKDF